MPELLIGTGNRGKVRELTQLFESLSLDLLTLADIPEAIDVEETGTTFLENATLKAVEQAKHLGRPVLAEDSGLAVDALGGAPGVHSKRFAGEKGDDDDNNSLLLEKLSGLPNEERGAGYVCVMVLADAQGNVIAKAEGTCRGRITTDYRGTGGFGYDPLFLIEQYDKTFGELPIEVKHELSHRGTAAKEMLPHLADFFTPLT